MNELLRKLVVIATAFLVLQASYHSSFGHLAHLESNSEESCDLCLSLTGLENGPDALAAPVALPGLSRQPVYLISVSSYRSVFLSIFSARAPPAFS